MRALELALSDANPGVRAIARQGIQEFLTWRGGLHNLELHFHSQTLAGDLDEKAGIAALEALRPELLRALDQPYLPQAPTAPSRTDF